jgi:prepilin-type N-terminal cleavage/methylation domain-containing protein
MRRMRQDVQDSGRQGGFSLIELLVAMTITLIVSGAIYGLMVSGQGAFRREPAVVERQQNIRIAMDLIVRDIQNAGAGMVPQVQAFTPDVPGNSINNPAAPGSVVSEIIPGERADYIEMMVNDGSCPALATLATPGATLHTREPLADCIFGTPQRPAFFYLSGEGGPAATADPNHPGLVFGQPQVGAGGCGNGHVTLPAGQAAAFNPPGGPCGGGNCAGGGTSSPVCRSISRIQFVRYEIAAENPAVAVNAITNPPSLWRSDMGRRNYDGSLNNGPYTGNDPGGNPSPWQLVARGIDDMQIRYFWNAAWADVPSQVINAQTLAARNSVVLQVQVTLSARAIGFDLGGETTYVVGAGTAGRRGQLTTQVTPRAAVLARSATFPGPNNPAIWR